jgi:hypothetical protein
MVRLTAEGDTMPKGQKEYEQPTAELVKVDPAPPAALERFNFVPKDLAQALEFSKLIASSNLCPPDYRGKQADVLLAIQMGLEVAGCSPLQALQNIAVINGRPSMWGDLVLAVVRKSGLLATIKERDPQECEAKGEGRCEVIRTDDPEPIVRTFTVAMAEKANLIGRSGAKGPWSAHRGRMLQMRARSWALRDGFGDVLKGLYIREEQEDIERVRQRPAIAMPRRASETPAIDSFLEEQQPMAPSDPGVDVQPETGTPTDEGNTWTGVITGISSRSGTTNGRDWTIYDVTTDGGPALGTFSDSMADVVRSYVESGEEVTVTWEVTKKKNKNITDVELARRGDAGSRDECD